MPEKATFKYIGTFHLSFVKAEEIDNDDERVKLRFGCKARVNRGDEVRTRDAEAVADFLGGVWKTKVPKKLWSHLKSMGVKPGVLCQIEAAIDFYSMPGENGRPGPTGVWFEYLELIDCERTGQQEVAA